ncbi:MAG TPA: type VI immunity family protein [Thermoanaerobaculia bacterium]|jgi:hypothetical protein|nr:type VI immunity family protein [Thermoanaerobaculia bacterium]
MSSYDERVKAVLAASGLKFGPRSRKYDGDVADLVAEGRTDFAPALAITMYFDGPRERFATGVIECWEELLAAYGDRLTWYADEEMGKWQPASGQRFRRPARRLADSTAMPFYAWTALSGPRYADASPITFLATVRDGAGEALSFVRATFPIARVASEAAAEDVVAAALRWCERVPFLHGYAGFTVNQSPTDAQINSGMLLQIADRFDGFEIDDCGGTALVARDAIKGVNWLTFLAPTFVERLGGAPSLRGRLSPAIGLHVLGDGGALIQAGRLPSYGDSNKSDELEAYREVARIVRPICLDTHPDLGPAEFGSFGSENTRHWLRRFDS